MPLPSLHRLSLATGSVLQTSQTSERIRVSLVEILETRVERFRESVASAVETTPSLEAERVFLRDVLLEYTIQRAFDVVCLHPPLALYVDQDAMNQLLAFLKRAQARIDPSNVFLREPLEEFVEELNEEADLATALLKRLEVVWTRLHETSQSFQQWAETFDDALSPLWTECRTGFNVKMFDGPRDYAKQLKQWWASEVGRKEWTPDESQQDEDEEDEEDEEGDDEDEDSQESEQGVDVEKDTTNLCPGVYAYGLYSGAVKRDAPLTYEHIISKSWCNTPESILELEHCIEDASLLALATRSRNVSRSNNLLPLLQRDKYRRSLSVRGLWKPLPMRGFSLPRRAVAARITARGFLAYPFLQPPTRSYENMEGSIIELAQSPHFSTQTPTSERLRCAEWEIGMSLLLWRELGVPFNVFTLFAHTVTKDAVVDAWRQRFDALLRLRLQEHDAFRALLLAHAPTLRIRQSRRTDRRDYDGSPRVTVRAADEDEEFGDDDGDDDEGGNDDERSKKRKLELERRLELNTPEPAQYLTMAQILEAFENGSAIQFLDNAQNRWKDGTVIEKGKRVQGSDGKVLVSRLKVSEQSDRYKIVLKV